MGKGSTQVLLNIFSPPPATLEENSLWFRPEGASISIGFGGKDDIERLTRLFDWLSNASLEVGKAIREIDRIPLATSRPLDTSRREVEA
jgi:hypothetical protein